MRRAPSLAFAAFMLALGLAGAARGAHAQAAGAASSRPAASASASASAAPRGSASVAPPLAEPALAAEVMVLLASDAADAGVERDPALRGVAALDKPPFSAFRSFRLVRRERVALLRGVPARTTLPDGRVLELSLKERLGEGRARIAASVGRPGGASFLPLLEVAARAGEPFFVAGQSWGGGTLVLGISLAR